MQEPDLITQLSNASVDARAIVAALSAIFTGMGTQTLTLSNGNVYTLTTIPQLQANYAAANAALQLSYLQAISGAVTSIVPAYDAFGNLTGVTTTYLGGYQTVKTFAYNAAGLVSSIVITLYDNLSNQLGSPITKTLTYNAAGNFTGLS